MDKQEMTITDLSQLAALKVHRVFPVATNFDGIFSQTFVGDRAKYLLERYQSNQLWVDARQYASALKDMKHLMISLEKDWKAKAAIRTARQGEAQPK